ncbi:MAG: polyribonucleotide nucleotidyltransferase, partial [Deltaproteobacteria bacterium]|nr:polyribonucleotide nucleotidyltransferase [Deltaproteobacteria bacterium]
MIKVEREIGGQILSIEVGKLAKQATGAAVVRYGETVVLGTVVHGPPRAGVDFFPLTVDYREKMSAAGRFPGGFFKREGRPTNKEILTMRLIDRPLRPLFPELFKDEIQIQVMVLSSDLQNDPDVIGFVSAAAALAVAPVPFNGPAAAVRVARINGNFVLNPTIEQRMESDCDIVVAGPEHSLNMIEVGARELSEDVIADAIEFGHTYGVVPICEMLAALRKKSGAKSDWKPEIDTKSLVNEIKAKTFDDFAKAKSIKGKQERNDA